LRLSPPWCLNCLHPHNIPVLLPKHRFDLRGWIAHHRLPVVSHGPWGIGDSKWILNPCPWNAEHTNRAAYIVQFANGAIAAGCHNQSCAGKDWHALRVLYDPAWRRS
jgi:hypothetical protein